MSAQNGMGGEGIQERAGGLRCRDALLRQSHVLLCCYEIMGAGGGGGLWLLMRNAACDFMLHKVGYLSAENELKIK